jgi:hypothetical protein
VGKITTLASVRGRLLATVGVDRVPRDMLDLPTYLRQKAAESSAVTGCVPKGVRRSR